MDINIPKNTLLYSSEEFRTNLKLLKNDSKRISTQAFKDITAFISNYIANLHKFYNQYKDQFNRYTSTVSFLCDIDANDEYFFESKVTDYYIDTEYDSIIVHTESGYDSYVFKLEDLLDENSIERKYKIAKSIAKAKLKNTINECNKTIAECEADINKLNELLPNV